VLLLAEGEQARIYGPMTDRFSRLLQGAGRAFGIKFQPAGFRSLFGSALSTLTNRRVSVSEIFGSDGDALVERLLSVEDELELVEVFQAFVRARLPAPDPNVSTINAIVERIMADRRITRVDDVVARHGVGERALQRLFGEYVGVSPTWVIRRYRLQEAADRLVGGVDVDLAGLARELGYGGQARLARDFSAIVGKAPAEYSRKGGA
jgi:transcriptional regulator GlxA family with amidase domain